MSDEQAPRQGCNQNETPIQVQGKTYFSIDPGPLTCKTDIEGPTEPSIGRLAEK